MRMSLTPRGASASSSAGFIYSGVHQSAVNDDFKRFLAEVDKNAIPSLFSMEGYDGIHIIYKMIEATQGKQDGRI
jgi:branched-chain amino acid transport system substrate-binding protein